MRISEYLREVKDTTLIGGVTYKKVEKKRQWNLHIHKSRPTRWDYTLINPQGGSFGMSSYPSIKAAIHAATARIDFQGAKKIWVIISKWDPTAGKDGDYIVSKTYWMDV